MTVLRRARSARSPIHAIAPGETHVERRLSRAVLRNEIQRELEEHLEQLRALSGVVHHLSAKVFVEWMEDGSELPRAKVSTAGPQWFHDWIGRCATRAFREIIRKHGIIETRIHVPGSLKPPRPLSNHERLKLQSCIDDPLVEAEIRSAAPR